MSRGPCQSRYTAIISLAMGEIAFQDEAELRHHLHTCKPCRDLHEELVREEEFLCRTFAKWPKDDKAALVSSIKREHAGLQVADTDDQVDIDIQPKTQIVSRASRFRGLGAWSAAVILLLGFALLFNRFQTGVSLSSVTFADVVQQLDRVRSVTFTKTVQEEGEQPFSSQAMAMDPGHLRIVDPDGSVSVRDFVAGKEITIFPQSKTASRVSRVYYEKERLTKYIDWIESLHKSAARFVGQKDLNGKLTNVFTFDRLFEHYTIWTDPVTNLPFQVERIELPSPDKDVKPSQISLFLSDFCDKAGGRPIGPDPVRNIVSWRPGTRTRKVTTTMTGFSWDVPLDESLFGVTVPDGYKVVDEVDWGAPPEDRQALIESLRFWAEASDGDFPADINMLLDARPKLIRKFHENGPAELEYAAALKMAQVVVNGACFAQTQEAQGNWYYAGGDVRLGQADKPLCWWLNDDGATYCVIYGDLSSRDVTACRIPSHVQ